MTNINDEKITTRSALARAQTVESEGDPFLPNDPEGVVMAHYEVEPTNLQSLVPFQLDLYRGKAYVGLVSFTMRNLRPARLVGGSCANGLRDVWIGLRRNTKLTRHVSRRICTSKTGSKFLLM